MTRPSAVRRPARPRRLALRLYIAAGCRNSIAAEQNLRAALASQPPGTIRLEIIDVFRAPQRALADRVLVTPTLIRLAPRPVLTVVGDLSDRAALDAVLELPTGDNTA